MTLDSERKRAVEWAYEFLGRLADPRRSKRVPSEVRFEAYSIHRHFPQPLEMAGWDGRQLLGGATAPVPPACAECGGVPGNEDNTIVQGGEASGCPLCCDDASFAKEERRAGRR